MIINVTVEHKTRTFQLHVHPDLTIDGLNVTEILPGDYGANMYVNVLETGHCDSINIFPSQEIKSKRQLPAVTWKEVKMQPKVEIDLHADDLEPGAILLVNITFSGEMYAAEGLFRKSYVHPLTKETKW